MSDFREPQFDVDTTSFGAADHNAAAATSPAPAAEPRPADAATTAAESQEFSYPSMFGTAEVFDMQTPEGDPVRALYVDGGFHSLCYTDSRRFEPAFEYCKAFDTIFHINPDAKRILVLGGGAFSWPKHVLATCPDVQLDVVEIDPVIVDIARKHFFLDEATERFGADRLNVTVDDGRRFLANAEPGTYDAIVNDTFAGTAMETPLLAPDALLLAKRALAPVGLYLLNAVAEDDLGFQDHAALHEVYETLAQQFSFVRESVIEALEFSGAVNHVFFARE